MPITVEWYNEEQQAIIQRFEGTWDWQDLGDSIKTVEQLTAGRPTPSLVDMSQTRSLPGGNVLLYGKNYLSKGVDNITHVIFVIDSQLIKTFVAMIFGVAPTWRNRTQFVKTVEEGRQIIDRVIAQKAVGIR